MYIRAYTLWPLECHSKNFKYFFYSAIGFTSGGDM